MHLKLVSQDSLNNLFIEYQNTTDQWCFIDLPVNMPKSRKLFILFVSMIFFPCLMRMKCLDLKKERH